MALEIPALLTNSVVLSSFAFLVLVWLIFHRAAKKLENGRWKFSLFTAIVLVGWFSLVFVLGRMGVFALDHLVAPYIFIGFILLFGILQKVYISSRVRNVADAISVPWIIGIQTYRIVGVGFFILYARGFLPGVFAFPAGIGDILVGVTAPFVATFYYLKKSFSRRLAIIWNIIGIIDLVVAVGVGILGYPRPLQVLPLEPSTGQFSLFPLALISLFAVPLALLLHFLSLRVLLRKL